MYTPARMPVEERVLTIPAALERASRLYGGQTAYATAEEVARQLDWADVYRGAVDFGAGLIALGLERGDRVAICAENGLEWITACFGVLAAGGAVVPIYYDLKPAEIAEQLRRPQCRMVIASSATLARVPERSPGLETIVVIGDGRREHRAGFLRRHPARIVAFDSVPDSATSDSRLALAAREPGPDDLAAVIFTSGTTGGAKGVMLSHRNFLANGHSTLGAIDVSERDTVLLVLPLHHAMPFMAAIVLPVLVGAKVVIENDVRRVRDRLAQAKPTLFFGVPALYEIMYRNVLARAEAEGRLATLRSWQKRVEAIKRSSGVNVGALVFSQVHRALGGRLRFLVSGGAALSPTTARAFFSLGLPLLQGWGMTEASPVVALQRFSARRFRLTRYYESHAGSVGLPVPGVEVQLIDVPEKDIRVALQGEGEVIVRGENVFRGYWQAEEQTRQAMLNDWLRTGDLARFDREGNIYLTGRSKYIIVLESGEKVHPDELEEKFGESPVLEDVCVVPRRARDRTQVGAIIYPSPEATVARLEREGLEVTEESVRRLVGAEVERLGREMAAFKRVTQILIADAPLPKTALQKVARGLLADEYAFSVKRWREGGGEGLAPPVP